jgi:hypothetical protein
VDLLGRAAGGALVLGRRLLAHTAAPAGHLASRLRGSSYGCSRGPRMEAAAEEEGRWVDSKFPTGRRWCSAAGGRADEVLGEIPLRMGRLALARGDVGWWRWVSHDLVISQFRQFRPIETWHGPYRVEHPSRTQQEKKETNTADSIPRAWWK